MNKEEKKVLSLKIMACNLMRRYLIYTVQMMVAAKRWHTDEKEHDKQKMCSSEKQRERVVHELKLTLRKLGEDPDSWEYFELWRFGTTSRDTLLSDNFARLHNIRLQWNVEYPYGEIQREFDSWSPERLKPLFSSTWSV